MILTEDRKYFLSLDIEDENEAGLGNEIVELQFTNKELLHAILTCGMPIQRLTFGYPGKRKMEVLQKIFLVETALEANGEHLKKSTSTMYLDSSEKSVISYYLGMIFTKLISKKLYGMEHLTSLNTIQNMSADGYLDYFRGQWRPDLIGHKMADDIWSVWEAKGGSNRREPALKMGCEQAGDIQHINGNPPEMAAVCMTYYDHGYLTAALKKTKSTEGELLSIDKKHFYASYYLGIRELFQEFGNTAKWRNGNVEVTLEIPYFHDVKKSTQKRQITVGCSEQLYLKLMTERYEDIQDVDCVPIQKADEARTLFGDGIYIL